LTVRRHPSDIPDARLLAVLDKYVPPIIARSILERARREAVSGPKVSWIDPNGLLDRISVGVKMYAEPDEQAAILREITDLALAEREEQPTSYRLDAVPSSSKKPTASAAASSPVRPRETPGTSSPREDPPTRREPALAPPSSATPKREGGSAGAWPPGSPSASSLSPHGPPNAWPVGSAAGSSSSVPAPGSPWSSTSSPASTAPNPGQTTSWSSGSTAGSSAPGHEPSPSLRDHNGHPSRRAPAEGSSVSRGVFSTAGPRAPGPAVPSTGPGAGPRVQVVRAPPDGAYRSGSDTSYRAGPPAAASSPAGASRMGGGTPPAGMPRVQPAAREGAPGASRGPIPGMVPRAPGRVEITHAYLPKPPPVPSTREVGLAMPRGQQAVDSGPKEMTISLATEHDIPLARQIAREICERLGTRALTQQRLLTIVSELGRNMVLYAGGGQMTLRPPTAKSRRIVVIATDQGPGIPNLSEIMAGRYKSRSGLGLGLLGTKRLADSFNVETGRAGTTVSVEVIL
jgi:anti-sigma regulatory factor (Ser/Thr protein kinase)